MEKDILISIIIPLYNAMPFCKKLMESIYEKQSAETQDDIEVIVIDDGSTDDGGTYMDQLAKEHANLTVVHQENSGMPSIPRNRGIDLAKGKYIFFADADDWFYPNAITEMVEYAKTHEVDVAIFEVNASSWGEDYYWGLFKESREHCTLLNSKIINSLGPYKLFRRDLINENQIRFPIEGYYEDLPFAMEAFYRAKEISVVAGHPYYCYYKRKDKKNLSAIVKTTKQKITGLLNLFATSHRLTTPEECPVLFVKSIKYVFKNEWPYTLLGEKDFDSLEALREALVSANCEEVRSLLPIAMLARFDAWVEGDYDIFRRVYEEHLMGPDFSFEEKAEKTYYKLRLPGEKQDEYYIARLPEDCGFGRMELEDPLVRKVELHELKRNGQEVYLAGHMSLIRKMLQEDEELHCAISVFSEKKDVEFPVDITNLKAEHAYASVWRYTFDWSGKISLAGLKPYIGKKEDQVKLQMAAHIGDDVVWEPLGRERKPEHMPEWIKKTDFYEGMLFHPIETEAGNLAINLIPASGAGMKTKLKDQARLMREKMRAKEAAKDYSVSRSKMAARQLFIKKTRKSHGDE